MLSDIESNAVGSEAEGPKVNNVFDVDDTPLDVKSDALVEEEICEVAVSVTDPVFILSNMDSGVPLTTLGSDSVLD